MSVVSKLPDFPGFACEYDPKANPFFKAIMVENLRKLKSVPLGEDLLQRIADARPRARSIPKDKRSSKFRWSFPSGVNVMCQPSEVSFTQRGFKRDLLYGADNSVKVLGLKVDRNPTIPTTCPFAIEGGSVNEAVNQAFTANGGTVCWMRFSNVQIVTRSGVTTQPFVVLAHELIHSLHCLTGTHHGDQEELVTTGIGAYAGEPMSENAFRTAFGLQLRTAY